MNFRRRVATGIALLAVTFASLWPLVTSAHAWVAGDEMTLCHGAGTMVAPDAVPRPMDPAPARDGQVHCPLCIMAFYGSAPPALVVAPPQFSTHFVTLAAYEAPRPAQHAQLLTQSRAPPALIAS